MVLSPLTVVGCFAHPDDETWMMAGSLALLVPKGVRCAVWTATRGQAGQIAEGSGATRATLPAVREAEERAALALLGVRDVEFGEFMDGEVDQAEPGALVGAVGDFLDRWQPDVVVTMEPGGITSHVDHVAVTAAVQAAFAAYLQRAEAAGRAPRLYMAGLPESRLARWLELAEAAGVAMPGPDDPYAPKATPDDQFACSVDTSGVAELVLRALQQHRTQASEYTILVEHEDFWRPILSREDYVRLHPAQRPGQPLESSLVEAFAGGSGG